MSDTFDRSQLDGKDREQLSEIASALGVKSISRMRKADLVDAIVAATAGANGASEKKRDAPARRKVRSTAAAGVDDLASLADEENKLATTDDPADSMAMMRPRRRPRRRTARAARTAPTTPHPPRRVHLLLQKRTPLKTRAPTRRPTTRPIRRTAASTASSGATTTAGTGAAAGGAVVTATAAATTRARTPRSQRRLLGRLDRRRRSPRPPRRGLRLLADLGLCRRSQRRLRVGVAGASLRVAQGRLRQGRDAPAREQREVPRARPRRPHQRADARRGARPRAFRRPHAALPRLAAAPRARRRAAARSPDASST